MKINLSPVHRVLSIVIVTVVLAASCAGDPEPLPSPPPEPAPPAPPEPVVEEEVPEPEPLGHAPLVGTRWTLRRLYGDMRRLTPQEREVWIEFQPGESAEAGAPSGMGAIRAQGPQNPITGRFHYRVDQDSPRTTREYEEGTLTGEEITRNRAVGSFSELEDVLLENLQLLKGYYIAGDAPDESTLTIWGGFRTEEVVLMELASTTGEEATD